MINLLKLLGLTQCFLCEKIFFRFNTVERRFVDDPKDLVGYKKRICKSCDYSLD